ncbi:hypothetical protein QR680_002724 [Steinernema hermaphroditum]|uniref:Uncharacterized protein n=1 Tax=Steinernema hermaphroditum TaxID=289476 RepID=A0AA39H3T2_9BILA|nr:hypothetical protein QR680_002724 [Steinernema hermaphroditum]
MTAVSENETVDGVVPPWDGFRQWVHCICVVTFDLEIGQAIEVVYPGDAYLSSVEKTNICYLAFPDSNSCCTGESDMNFHFRIRRSSLKLQESQQAYSERVPNCKEKTRRFHEATIKRVLSFSPSFHWFSCSPK